MFLICLNPRGLKNNKQFSIVVVNKKSSHKFVLETIGYLNVSTFKFNNEKAKCFSVDVDRLNFWLARGASLTSKLTNLLKLFKIVY